MLDTDGDEILTLDELRDGLRQNRAIQNAVRKRRDGNDIMRILFDYFNAHRNVIELAFQTLDEDEEGSLSQPQLQVLLSLIPNLQRDDLKFILAYMYQYDPNRDGRIDFIEFQEGMKAFFAVPDTIAEGGGEEGEEAAAAAAAADEAADAALGAEPSAAAAAEDEAAA